MEVTRGIGEWADSLLEFRRAQGFSGEKYGLYLRSFVSYCSREFPESREVSSAAVNGWLDEEAGKGFPGAMPEKATVMRTLGKYILAFGGSAYVLPYERHGTRVRYTPHVFSDEELAALFDEIDKATAARPCQQAVKGAYSVLFRLIYTCGLRPQEGRLARAQDLDLAAGTLFIREAKFHSERMVGLSAQMVGLLAKYKRRLDRALPNSTYLFPKCDGKPVGKHGLADYFHDRWLAANRRLRSGSAPRVRVYDLRHRFASAVLQKWMDEGREMYVMLPFLRAYMGHAEMSSTLYYVHLLPENMRRSAKVDWAKLNAIVPEVES